jgi:hypothetical protein
LFEGRDVEGREVGSQADLLDGLPLGAGFGCRRGVVDLDGQLEGAGVGDGEDDGAGVGGRTAAPAEGHLFGVLVVVGEADQIAAFPEIDSERRCTDQHGKPP